MITLPRPGVRPWSWCTSSGMSLPDSKAHRAVPSRASRADRSTCPQRSRSDHRPAVLGRTVIMPGTPLSPLPHDGMLQDTCVCLTQENMTRCPVLPVRVSWTCGRLSSYVMDPAHLRGPRLTPRPGATPATTDAGRVGPVASCALVMRKGEEALTPCGHRPV
jgi:hypothetical protein